MKTIRLTMAQALVRYLAAQRIRTAAGNERLFHGVFAIFGHGNVAGLGEALAGSRERVARRFARTMSRPWRMPRLHSRRRIGGGDDGVHDLRRSRSDQPRDGRRGRPRQPAASAPAARRHVCEPAPGPRTPASRALRRSDGHGQRLPETGLALLGSDRAARTAPRVLAASPRGPARSRRIAGRRRSHCRRTFKRKPSTIRSGSSTNASTTSSGRAPTASGSRLPFSNSRSAKRPLIVAGGGVHYSGACEALAAFAATHGIPVAETQAGKGALPWDHACNAGALGVTGSSAANHLLAESDLVLALGTRLADFTTGSGKLIGCGRATASSRSTSRATTRSSAAPSRCAATSLATLEEIVPALKGWSAGAGWRERTRELAAQWNAGSRGRDARGAGPAD